MKPNEQPLADWAKRVLDQLQTVIVGKDEVLLWALAAILAKGHILIEDVPGVGKTTMALGFSKVLDLDYGRVQFTPDVLPSDVTGYTILDPKTGEMRFQKGAIMCNLFLADELNRATSRTQAALLESMEEGQVTVDGVTYPLSEPFTVIATQNPTGAAGTQLLPDSQMDRFTVRLSMGYPTQREEIRMVADRRRVDPLKTVRGCMSREELAELQRTTSQTHISDEVVAYIVSLVTATRDNEWIERGASPRATLSVAAMARAVAVLLGRDYVTPDDVREVFVPTVAHRLILSAKAEGQGMSPEAVLKGIADAVVAPRA